MISRRKLLLYATAALGSATIASSIVVGQWWNTSPQEPYTHLNKEEAHITLLIAKAAFPAGEHHNIDGEQARLDRFFDQFLGHLESQNRKLLKLLLQATDRVSIPLYGQYFSNLPSHKQQSCLEYLINHQQHLIRSAYQSLIAILGMGFSTHPDMAEKLSLLHRCGYG